ncbi:DnaB-like helicase C-terminal domain-containing protein [Paenibacillus sp. y28]|uniref:DnaB-like helicase C-terminal domain-containing protein n=1 Tax=Paenibacillus sp. y28 TaxID=3129110 RepID=UPI00301954F2
MAASDPMNSLRPSLDLEQLLTTYQKQLRDEAFYYLEKRGITPSTAEHFRLGYEPGRIGFVASAGGAPAGMFENRIIIPVIRGEQVVDLIGRAVDHREPKYKFLLNVDDVFFNGDALEETEDIILCTGPFDVMSLHQVDIPAVCVPGHLGFKEQHAELLKGRRVFLCLGNDESGRRESVRISDLLQEQANEIYTVHLPESVKDINDLFVKLANPFEAFMQLLHQTVEHAMITPIAPDVRNVTVFVEEYMKRHRGQTSGIPTGIAALDQALLGGLQPGFILLAGELSCGKTMLLKQLADYMAGHGTPVIFASWDLTRFELWCRGIARILGVAPQLILNGRIDPQAVGEANKQYAQISQMLWTLECAPDMKLDRVAASIEKIAASAGKAPVIIIDDLARISPFADAAKTRTAESAFILKQWAMEWNCPVIAALPLEHGQTTLPLPLEAAADMIMQLGAAPLHTGAHEPGSILHLQLAKNRNGSLHTIGLRLDEHKVLFTEYEP